jgi:hypothetical protein
MQQLTLVIAFRETGWRRPLRDPVALEVWGADAQLLAVLPASYLEELLRAHLWLDEIQHRLGAYRQPLAPAPEPSPVAPPRLRGAQRRRLRRPAV